MKNERPKIPIDFCSQNSVIDSMEICMLEKNNLKNATLNSIENQSSKETNKETILEQKTFIEEDLRPESILLEFAQIAVKLTKKLSIDSSQSSSFNQTEPNKDDFIKLDYNAFEKTIENETSLDNRNEFLKNLKFKEVPWILPKKNAFQTIMIVVSLFHNFSFFCYQRKKIPTGDVFVYYYTSVRFFSLLFKTNQLNF